MVAEERPKQGAEHSRLVGSGLKKQGNLLMRLVLGNWKMNTSSHQPTRILKVYVEALSGLSHVYRPDGLENTLLSLSYALGTAPTVGIVGRTVCSKERRGGEEPSIAHVQVKGQLAAIAS